MKYTIEELMPLQIGKGSERLCFRSPANPDNVIKISPVDNAKQTTREIKYFQYLQRQQIPFTHIPEFYGIVEIEGYIGFEQEMILDSNGNPAPSINNYLPWQAGYRRKYHFSQKEERLFHDLFNYLYKYNIVPCDLGLSNILIDNRKDQIKLVLIDGFGCTEFIPIAQYFAFLGREKIKRKWNRFMRKDIFHENEYRSLFLQT